MRRFTVLVCSLGVALVLLAVTVPLWAYDPEQSNSRGPTGYRGCVASSFDVADPRDEIVCDFGTQGVWAYATTDQSWHLISDKNPAWMFSCRPGGASAAAYLVASFDTGVWVWNYAGFPGTWTQLTPSFSNSGFAVDDDGDGHEEIQLGFAPGGVWRHDFDTHLWLQYTTSVPNGGRRSDMGTWGWHEGLWAFGTDGLWVFYATGTTPTASMLTSSAATFDDVVAARFDPSLPAESIVADFALSGTWLSNASVAGTMWTEITPSAPRALTPIHSGTTAATLPVYNLIFADDTSRPWIWSKSGGFAAMTSSTLEPGFCEPYAARGRVDTSGRQQAACDFGSDGLWEYDQSGTWKQLTVSNPVSMLRCDFYGVGVKVSLVVNFGPGVGLWLYRFRGRHFLTAVAQAHAKRARFAGCLVEVGPPHSPARHNPDGRRTRLPPEVQARRYWRGGSSHRRESTPRRHGPRQGPALPSLVDEVMELVEAAVDRVQQQAGHEEDHRKDHRA